MTSNNAFRFNKFLSAIGELVDDKINKIHTSMPAKIALYSDGIATVQPLLPYKLSDGRVLDMPLITDVPVCFPAASGMSITFPLVPGDEGWLSFAESALEDYLDGIPTSDLRKFALSDAVFFPVSVKNHNKQYPNDLCMRFFGASIRLTKDGKVIISGDVEVSGEMTAKNIAYSNHVHLVVKEGKDTEKPHNPVIMEKEDV